MPDDRPLVLTAALDPDTAALLGALRRRHFPPERNHLDAHLTLFHALPGTEVARVTADLEEATRTTAPPHGTATDWWHMGRGVSRRIDAPALVALRDGLAARWAELLTRQDGHRPRLHVTVQNKVEPAVSKALHAALEREHAEPLPVTIPALELWHYAGGPWEPAARFPFAAGATATGEGRP